MKSYIIYIYIYIILHIINIMVLQTHLLIKNISLSLQKLRHIKIYTDEVSVKKVKKRNIFNE